MSKTNVIVLTGATGSGKSQVALNWAMKNNGVIVNSDAMQIYKYIPIITAQPSETEKRIVPHFLYSFQDIFDKYSVGKYLQDIQQTLQNINQKQKYENIIIVGGTMMYISAIINGLSAIPDIPEDFSKKMYKKYNEVGVEQLFQDLSAIDPDYAGIVDKNNPSRLLRGILVKSFTGHSIMHFWKHQNNKNILDGYNTKFYIINHQRDVLYKRIDERFDKMVSCGLIEEIECVDSLIKIHNESSNNMLKTSIPKAIGLQHMLDYVNGKISLTVAVELAKRDSRHYAKRQMTWFRNKFATLFQEIDCNSGIPCGD